MLFIPPSRTKRVTFQATARRFIHILIKIVEKFLVTKMASAVFRVKRRLDEQPYEKFVLNSKRIKLVNENVPNAAKADQKSIIKFAATLNAGDDIGAHLGKLQKPDESQNFHKARKPTDVVDKLRQQMKNDAKNQRFKILSDLREVDLNGSEKNEDAARIRVIDVEKECIDQQQPGGSKAAALAKADNFVYDLYLVDEADAEQLDVDNIESIKPFDDLIFQLYNDVLEDSDFLSDDSNDEGNWRNEYPDTDDGASVGDDDMRRAVEDLNFGDDADELSSDNENMIYTTEPVVHFIDTKNGDGGDDGNDGDDDDDYDYFKKHGRIKKHTEFYRPHRSFRARNDDNGDDSDEDGSGGSSRSSSSTSSASDLVSCDGDDNN